MSKRDSKKKGIIKGKAPGSFKIAKRRPRYRVNMRAGDAKPHFTEEQLIDRRQRNKQHLDANEITMQMRYRKHRGTVAW